MTPPETARNFATWLGLLSNASRLRPQGGGRLEACPVGPADDPCYLLVVNGWALLSTNGAITVFRDLAAVRHLLQRLGIEAEVETSSASPGRTPGPECRDCWAVDGGGLRRCTGRPRG